jgi:S-adenosylmethionine decarboxylase
MEAHMYNYKGWVVNTDPDELKQLFEMILKASGFTILGFAEYHFKPYGYSSITLLGDSHFAIHTFPEEYKTYIELSSCIEGKQQKFMKLLKSGDIAQKLATRSSDVDVGQQYQLKKE